MPHVKEVLALLKDRGIEARIVGGAVRNALLNLPVHDIDIAVAADPQAMITALKDHCHVIPTGIKHGTITAVFTHNVFQLTSLRSDVKSYGRHADVAFSDSFEEDARRRDFTMNALYLDAKGTLYDYFEGEHDLKIGRVRFIGDPLERIHEDYLRILRYFRMNAFFGKETLDPQSLRACTQLSSHISLLSRERIRSEFFKILAAPRAHTILSLMHEKNIFTHIEKDAHFKELSQLIALEEKYKLPPSPVEPLYRLYALYHTVEKSIISKSIVLTRTEQTLWSKIQKCFKESPSIQEILYRYSDDFAAHFLCLRESVFGDDCSAELCKISKHTPPPLFPIKANDIEGLGYQGKCIGEGLRLLEKYWCDNDFSISKDALLRHLKKYF